MSEVLQRFRERFKMWHEERRHGPSGPPAGHVEGQPQHRAAPARNPLSWGVVVAVIWLLPPYSFRDIYDFMVPASAVAFLAVYFARSRFAWHVLAIQVLVLVPLWVLFSFEWRLQRVLHPWIVWVPIVGTLFVAVILLRSRKRYFAYLEQQKHRVADERI